MKTLKQAAALIITAITAIFILAGTATVNAANGMSLSVSSSVSSKYQGAKIEVTAVTSGGTAPYQYKFLYKIGSGNWNTIKSYSTSKTASFTASKAGYYTIRSYVKDKNNQELYCDLNINILEKYTPPVNNSTISSKAINKGGSVTVKGIASGGTMPYNFKYYYKDQKGAEHIVKNYSTTSSMAIKFSTAGYYEVHCTLKDKNNKVLDKIFKVTVSYNTGQTLKNTSTLSGSVINKGQSVTINANASGGTQPYMYDYYYSLNGSGYKKLVGYTEVSKKTYTFASAGFYKIKIAAKDKSGKTSTVIKDLTIKYNTNQTLAASAKTNTTDLLDRNSTVSVTASASGGVQPYQYSFKYRIDNSDWKVMRDFSTTQTANIKLTGRGRYVIQVIVKDANGTQKTKSITVRSIDIKTNDSIEEKIKSDYGHSVTYNINSKDTSSAFEVYSREPNKTQWQKIQNYSPNKTLKLRPRSLGTTAYMIHTKDSRNTITTSYFTVTASIPQKVYEELDLINKERQKAGLTTLKLDTDLQFAANVRAEELEVLYDHNRPDGTRCFTVLDEYGIKTPTAMAENIAWGYPDVKDVVQGWMNSKMHKENILCNKYKKVGLGIYKKYYSQMFTS